MARAKRTDRAEARRRYRTATTTQEAGPALDPAAVPAAALPRDSRRNVAPARAKASPAGPPGPHRPPSGRRRGRSTSAATSGRSRNSPSTRRRSWLPIAAILGTGISS